MLDATVNDGINNYMPTGDLLVAITDITAICG